MDWQIYSLENNVPKRYLPLMLSRVRAGFPSPADDFIDSEIDLNEFLIKNPAATFHVRVSGSSMRGAGIFSGDFVTIDRSLEAQAGDIVLAIVNGEFTLKRLTKNRNHWLLSPENNNFKPIAVNEETEIVGVVIASFRKHKRNNDQSDCLS